MKSEVYRKKVDTQDELLVNILDVITCIKEHQDTLRRTTHVLSLSYQQFCGFTFKNIYYKLYQLCHLNNKYRY